MGLLDRRRSPEPPRRALTAAASTVDLGSRPEVASLQRLRKIQPWQDEAWAYRRGVGEIRYAMTFLSNACSQVRVIAGYVEDPAEDPVPLDEATGANAQAAAVARDAIARLGADQQSIGSRILGPGAENLEVAGEGALIGQVVDGDEEWTFRSTSEVRIREDRLWLVPSPDAGTNDWEPLDPETSYYARIWKPDPQYRSLADSPMAALRDVCEELLIVGRMIRNGGRSRIAGNGILAIPDEIDLVDRGGTATDDPEASSFWAELQRSMVTPIADESAASAVVPLLVRGPGEMIDKIKHVTLERPVSADLMGRQEVALRRIAMGLDIPPEVILGMADVNHWTAWQVDDSTFRHHLRPIVVQEVDGLTAGYLRPVMAAAGIPADVARRFVVWFDPAPLVQRPNRGADAATVHGAGALSDRALLEAHGFDPDHDAPTEEELLRRLALKRGTVDAPLEAALLELLVRMLPAGERIVLPAEPAALPAAPASAGDQPAAGEEDPSTPQPTTGIRAAADVAEAPANMPNNIPAPETTGRVLRAYPQASRRLAAVDRQLRDRVHAAADAAVRRTLERAGNRLRSRADSTGKAVVASLPARDVPRALGPALRASIDVTDEQLLDGAWTDLREQWQAWTAEAQGQSLLTAEGMAGSDDARTAGLMDLWAGHSDDGWEFLRRGLDTLTRRLMYADPDAADAITAAGEGSSSDVPFGLVRAAVATAGGIPSGSPGFTAEGLPLDPGQPVTGGFGTGDDLLESLLIPAGVEALGYEWVYGISTRHFDPHRELDGVVFPQFGSPALANPEPSGWPSATLAPGDHVGCHCDAMPVYADAASPLLGLETAGARDTVGDVTYDSSYLDFLRLMAADDIAAGRLNTDAVRTVAEADRIANHRPNVGT